MNNITMEKPDELIVQLAHLAGMLEAKGVLEPMEWNALTASIENIINNYYNDSSENHIVSSIEELAEQHFVQQFGSTDAREIASDQGYLHKDLSTLTHESKQSKSISDLLDHAALSTSIGRDNIASFFYTFSTSSSFPFKKGYVEVLSNNQESADRLFRQYFPDNTPGILNCAGKYTETAFDRYKKDCLESGASDWLFCHGVISEIGFKASKKHSINLTDDKSFVR